MERQQHRACAPRWIAGAISRHQSKYIVLCDRAGKRKLTAKYPNLELL